MVNSKTSGLGTALFSAVFSGLPDYLKLDTQIKGIFLCVCLCVKYIYIYIFSYGTITLCPLSGTAPSSEFVACPADGRRMDMEHL